MSEFCRILSTNCRNPTFFRTNWQKQSLSWLKHRDHLTPTLLYYWLTNIVWIWNQPSDFLSHRRFKRSSVDVLFLNDFSSPSGWSGLLQHGVPGQRQRRRFSDQREGNLHGDGLVGPAQAERTGEDEEDEVQHQETPAETRARPRRQRQRPGGGREWEL